jgi:hypothetical protein
MATTVRHLLLIALLLPASAARAGEAPLPGAPGWFVTNEGRGYEDYEGGVDTKVAHGGHASAWLRPKVEKPQPGGCLMQVISAKDYAGKRIRLSGWLKTEGVDASGLWMRIRPAKSDDSLAVDTMGTRPLKGFNDWTKAEVVLDVAPNADNIMFGNWVGLKGKVWLDDVKIEVVDRSVPTTDRPLWPSSPRNVGFEERP